MLVVPTNEIVNFPVAGLVDDEKPAQAIYNVEERLSFIVSSITFL